MMNDDRPSEKKIESVKEKLFRVYRKSWDELADR